MTGAFWNLGTCPIPIVRDRKRRWKGSPKSPFFARAAEAKRVAMANEDGISDEVRLYGWPLGQPRTYLTRGAMLSRLLCLAGALIVGFGLGVAWILLGEPGLSNRPGAARTLHEQLQGKLAIRQCCIQDIRATQEALTSLSVDARKLQIRLNTDHQKNQAAQKIAPMVAELEKESKALWEQLDGLLDDRNKNWRQQLRDIKINMEGLVEHFQVAEACCAPGFFAPLMKSNVQTAASRFTAFQVKVPIDQP